MHFWGQNRILSTGKYTLSNIFRYEHPKKNKINQHTFLCYDQLLMAMATVVLQKQAKQFLKVIVSKITQTKISAYLNPSIYRLIIILIQIYLTEYLISNSLLPPCVADANIIFLPCGFFFLFFFPCLISAVGDWMSTTLPHMVWD